MDLGSPGASKHNGRTSALCWSSWIPRCRWRREDVALHLGPKAFGEVVGRGYRFAPTTSASVFVCCVVRARIVLVAW